MRSFFLEIQKERDNCPWTKRGRLFREVLGYGRVVDVVDGSDAEENEGKRSKGMRMKEGRKGCVGKERDDTICKIAKLLYTFK